MVTEVVVISFFQDVLTRKGSEAPLPDNLYELGPEIDDPQSKSQVAPDSTLEGTVIFLQYSDASGELSKRRVRIESIDDTYLKGFCFLRNEKRTFIIDRIQSITDLNSGEIFEDARSYLGILREVGASADVGRVESNFSAHSVRKAKRISIEHSSIGSDDEADFLELVATIAAEIRILVFIARADSKLSSKEVKLLRKYIQARSEDLTLSITNDQLSKFECWIKSQFPNAKLLLQSMQIISSSGIEAVNSMLEMAEILVGIDGKITDTERQAYSDLKKALRSEALES